MRTIKNVVWFFTLFVTIALVFVTTKAAPTSPRKYRRNDEDIAFDDSGSSLFTSVSTPDVNSNTQSVTPTQASSSSSDLFDKGAVVTIFTDTSSTVIVIASEGTTDTITVATLVSAGSAPVTMNSSSPLSGTAPLAEASSTSGDSTLTSPPPTTSTVLSTTSTSSTSSESTSNTSTTSISSSSSTSTSNSSTSTSSSSSTTSTSATASPSNAAGQLLPLGSSPILKGMMTTFGAFVFGVFWIFV